MSTQREKFVELFGMENAVAIEGAARSHGNGVNDVKYGSDFFRWAIVIAIGYECFTRFNKSHGITASGDAINEWLKQPEQMEWLSKHDGDCDYLAWMTGVYNQYMPEKQEE